MLVSYGIVVWESGSYKLWRSIIYMYCIHNVLLNRYFIFISLVRTNTRQIDRHTNTILLICQCASAHTNALVGIRREWWLRISRYQHHLRNRRIWLRLDLGMVSVCLRHRRCIYERKKEGQRLTRLTNIPCLRHTRHTTSEIPSQQRNNGRKTPRQPTRYIPDIQIIAFDSTEPLVLDKQDQGEGDGPVSQQRDEIANDGR